MGDLPLVRAARIVVAVERYRRLHGETLPAALDRLVPDLLSAIPVDPFSGEALRFVPEDSGYVVYSVGDNRQDDGGDLERRPLPPPGEPSLDMGIRIRYR